MSEDFQLGESDLHPGPWTESENPFDIYAREVTAWHDREEAAWRIAGCPPFFDYNDEPYPVRPEDVR